MARKKKHPKMDPRLVSKQKWEIAYIAKKFGASVQTVLRIVKAKGPSRLRVYNELRSPSRLIS